MSIVAFTLLTTSYENVRSHRTSGRDRNPFILPSSSTPVSNERKKGKKSNRRSRRPLVKSNHPLDHCTRIWLDPLDCRPSFRAGLAKITIRPRTTAESVSPSRPSQYVSRENVFVPFPGQRDNICPRRRQFQAPLFIRGRRIARITPRRIAQPPCTLLHIHVCDTCVRG